MTRITYFICIFGSSFGIAACSGLLNSDQPAERVYWLEPLVVQGADSADGALPSIAISVNAAPGLDTDRLLILGPEARLNHYAAARWPDNIPEVFESLLAITLESTGLYSRVVKGSANRSAQQQLELGVRELYALADSGANAHTVRMVLSGYLTCPDSDRAISLQAAVSIDDNRLAWIVAAYQQAFHDVSRQLVTQLSETAC